MTPTMRSAYHYARWLGMSRKMAARFALDSWLEGRS
jgi:hypothetical protein